MARLLEFLDGVTTPTEPTQGNIIANQLACFANDAAFESSNGAAEECDIYGNETTNFVRFYDGTQWVSLVDDTKAQTIGGEKTFSGNVIIQGDLTTSGTITKINSTDMEIVDKNVILNKSGNDASSEGAGWTIERTGNNGSFVYENALTTKFKLGDIGSEIEIMDVSSGQTITNKSINGSNNTITNISLTGAVTDVLPIANGGTNASAKQAAFNNLAPTAADKGDIIVWNGTNWVLFPKDADAKVLTLDSGEAQGLIWNTPALGGTTILNWASFTPTGSWIANTTYTGRQVLVGNTRHVQVLVATSGVPTSANLTINTVLSETIKTADLVSTNGVMPMLGEGSSLNESGVGACKAEAHFETTTSVRIRFIDHGGTDRFATVTQAAPFTWGADDVALINFSYPVT